MSGEAVRWVALAVGALGLGAVLLWGISGLPECGRFEGAYGRALNDLAPVERKTTDVVTAINFDYRGYDTLGEEFILFTSIIGVVTLLRFGRTHRISDRADRAKERTVKPVSDAARVLGVALVGFTTCLGAYITTHGQVSPGGGFQGGVVVATALVVMYLIAGPKALHHVAPESIAERSDAAGASGFILVGLGGLLASGSFLANFLPLGTAGDVLSSGTIALISVSVGIEVAAAFTLLVVAFVIEVLERRIHP